MHPAPACEPSAAPRVLFRDRRYAILDKPAGLPVHAGPRGGPSVEDLFAALSRRRDGPWLVHRLDADTSGCLLVALRKSALVAAQAEFAAGRAAKTYWAVVTGGGPDADSGRIDNRLGKHTGPAGWRMAQSTDGQPAVTEWRVRGRGDGLAWLELHPRTGRTHQIRVHCAGLGTPIVGDATYGTAGGPRLHLLARSLVLDLDPPVAATAQPPVHMRDALRACGWTESG